MSFSLFSFLNAENQHAGVFQKKKKKSLQMMAAAMKLKDTCSSEEKL